MTIKTLIEAGEDTYRAAILEDDIAVSFSVIPKAGDATGAIYLARVKRVDPKINAAFLDLGDAGDAFLPYRQAKALKSKLSANISGLVHEGEKILVKIVAPSTDHDKLPLATANPMIAGRYALSGHLKGKATVARSIAEGEKRQALEELLEESHNGNALIIRSAAANAPKDLVQAEIEKQQAMWETLEGSDQEPGLVMPAPDPMEQILRDFAPPHVDEILVEGSVAFLAAKKIADQKWPDLKGKVARFDEGKIMDAFGVEERLEGVTSGVVPLPSGGDIRIEETAAMTVIDVNSGAGRKGTSPGALHLSTNLEATLVIAREVRFQNLFGLVTVDFIDMRTPEDREKVTGALRSELNKDNLPVETTGINRFGILTIKRARRGQNLKTLLEHFAT
ncbi:MAG: ribonuclease E/G [Sphingomonadales bacterium]